MACLVRLAPASRADVSAERGVNFLSVITVLVRRPVSRGSKQKLGELSDTLILEHTCRCMSLIDEIRSGFLLCNSPLLLRRRLPLTNLRVSLGEAWTIVSRPPVTTGVRPAPTGAQHRPFPPFRGWVSVDPSAPATLSSVSLRRLNQPPTSRSPIKRGVVGSTTTRLDQHPKTFVGAAPAERSSSQSSLAYRPHMIGANLYFLRWSS